MWRTLKNSGPALGLITTFTIVISFLVGSLIYYFEGGTFKARRFVYKYVCMVRYRSFDRPRRRSSLGPPRHSPTPPTHTHTR